MGDFTNYAMTLAGIDRRRTIHRVAAIIAAVVGAALVLVIVLDLTGVATIPGMGLVYDATGFEDPNAARAVERYEAKLADEGLSDEKRAALREQLMGAQQRAGEQATDETPVAPTTVGVEDTRNLEETERAALADVFADEQKSETRVALKEPEAIQTPNLPDGLTGEAIQKVIADNAGSMRLCVAESAKKGEVVDGRMDMQVTIAADGHVLEVNVEPLSMATTVIGKCAIRRIRNWTFPKFNGEPVTVEYPYLLQTSAF